MNIELKPIAESKVRQLGGDVCGVLVRKDGKLAAVDEHGRVQWLQSGQGAEPVAFIEDRELEALREGLHIVHVRLKDDRPDCTPLYTHPQPAPTVPAVPEGWKLVPVEPTEEMREGFHRANDRYENGFGEAPDSHWRAMLNRAPQPPVGQEDAQCNRGDSN